MGGGVACGRRAAYVFDVEQTDGEPLAFAGDAETRSRLVDGPTRDLNLMLRGVAGAMRRVVPAAAWRPEAGECGLYATSPGRCRASPSDGHGDGDAMPQ